MTTVADALEPVSFETPEGRILTGVGTTVEDLQQTTERRLSPDAPVVEPVTSSAEPPADETPVESTPADRNADGTFKPKKTHSPNKRIDQLTAEREEAKREAAELRTRLEALEQNRPRQAEPVRAEPVKATATPKPTEDEIGTKYQTYADFVEALSEWKADEKLATFNLDARIRSSIEADRASRSFTETVQSILTRGRAAYSDFDAVIGSSTVNFPMALLERIVQLPNSEHLQYQLAKDPALATRLAQMQDGIAIGMELARLAPTPTVAQGSTAEPVTTTTAPAPINPLGGRGKTTVVPLTELATNHGDDFDSSGYRERRRAERKAAGLR